ncbi:MAG: ferritin-like domain-containing protein [Proteobacteria bacterium]|nr:ferritin-like domain-containing protein [Pseudomonadota bacterium]
MHTLDLRQAARARRPAIETPTSIAPAVIATWRGRMINEHGSSCVFEGLAAQLAALGRVDDAAQCRLFADEEREHGALCGAVVEASGGAALAEVSPPSIVPAHADTTPRAAVVRNMISICCLSETVAVALIGAERLEMPEGPLRVLLDKIWADEIGHSRFGWRYVAHELAALTPDELDAVARYLPVAFGHLEAHELAHIPVATTWPAEGVAYGLCDGGDARALFYDTVTEVIIPQLEAHGLSAARAWDQRRTA